MCIRDRFDIKDTGEQIEIIHSLAKWKRMALRRYGYGVDEGIYTDMNAIRRDEELDNLHSIYVDQWDWELTISREERNQEFLRDLVGRIYGALRRTEDAVMEKYSCLDRYVPEKLHFMTTQELEDRYPALSPKAVSYTHLDVYKRQGVSIGMCAGMGIGFLIKKKKS